MIIDCIIEILKNSDDVYINELGLFEKKRTSSEIQENQISPPQIKVFFDEKGEGNGFAFILKYAEKKQKRINDADVEIRQWIEELKNSLANNKSITFENFGTFSLNPKNEIIFESGWIKELNI
ncbi:hypothetical protein LJB75_00155, partial [Bacteroidales bacterium OttesenSCG-928-L19]|nr:hypothetical protein [Bacteroidales bacterium OttesenSCG-928-L19]